MFRNFFSLIFLFPLLRLSASTIWPQPKHVSIDTSNSISIPLSCDVNLLLNSLRRTFPSKAKCMITQAFERASKNFKSQVPSPSYNCAVNPLNINLLVTNPSYQSVNPSKDSVSQESYKITINPQSEIFIEAATTIAALRAAWTFFQIPTNPSRFIQHPISIRDEPTFIYRAIMMDTTRSISVTEGQRHPIIRLYEMIDRMEVVKMNILHWHLTDTDGLSFQVDNVNVTSPYSVDEIKKVVQYGLDHGITVLPEVDIMGHSGTVWGRQTNIPSFAPWDCPYQFNLDSPQATQFITNLFKNMTTKIFTNCPILATGQDEVAPCGNNYVRDATALQNKLGQIAKNAGKRVLVWGDTILEQGLIFDSRITLVAPWREYEGCNGYAEGVNKLVERGYKVVVYNQNPWYIGRETTAEGLYSYNPLDGVQPSNVGAVLGGAVSLWEPSLRDLEHGSIFWPMSAAVGEVLWSGSRQGGEFNEERYDKISTFLRNVPASVVSMVICK
ncbi:beta-hexosaminidase 1 [Folsomia candida]|uniref:beta-hexosaminidase 1 n=1 Tax=Folsomia candida TaxID=158441 RepID=UPI000B90A2AF|nr:beta-hexosaminidase 1 [Folsomia candida]